METEENDRVFQREILIIDDQPDSISFLTLLLTQEGYKTRQVFSGQQALEAIDIEPPDLIVIDILMPKMNGFKVCTALKSNPKTSQIPVIFLSAVGDTTAVATGFKVGGADYITKPFQVEEVLARVKDQFQLQNFHRALQQRNKELERKNRAMQTLNYINRMFAHEFLDPLNVLKLSLNILQEKSEDQFGQQNQELFEFADDAIQRQTQAVEQLLILTNPQLSDLRLDAVELDRIATKIAHQLNQRQPERKNVTWQIQPNCIAICDPNLLTIVLRHLFENAWNFTQSVPQPRIEFGCCPLATLPPSEHPPASSPPLSPDTTLYYVRDNGIGFEPTQAKQLFTAFYTLHPNSPFSGKGIGLTIVEQLIDAHQGIIWATAQPQQGATFYLTLPSDLEHSI